MNSRIYWIMTYACQILLVKECVRIIRGGGGVGILYFISRFPCEVNCKKTVSLLCAVLWVLNMCFTVSGLCSGALFSHQSQPFEPLRQFIDKINEFYWWNTYVFIANGGSRLYDLHHNRGRTVSRGL